MQGTAKVIEVLNSLLADELTAVNQYMVHAEMCENWGYDKLGGVIQKRAIEEMKHAEKLIGRILFLEGSPVVNNLREIRIGPDVPKMFSNDHLAEDEAIKAYNQGIVVCAEAKDYATRKLLQDILQDEDRHMDNIEEIQDEITQLGIQIFLSTQVK
jgi:bacterioferritin